jgi:pSer/pThr/pTyr-binding forkhead associated (FHA) protein
MAKLICTAGPNLGDEWEVGPGLTTIGRRGDNDVVLHDTKISRHHATLRLEGDKYTIEDRGSLNGTIVYGKRVGRSVVSLETPIQIGNTTLLLTRKSRRDVGLEYVEAVGEDLLMKHKSKRAVMSEILRDLHEAKSKPAEEKPGLLGKLLGGAEKAAPPPLKKKDLRQIRKFPVPPKPHE